MKVALVHDYIKEFGGAERVLEALCEIFPEAPIYTAFCVSDSPAGKIFTHLRHPEFSSGSVTSKERILKPPRQSAGGPAEAGQVQNDVGGEKKGSHRIIASWGNWLLPKFHLYSILRFLTPLIWESFDFDGYDLVISSSSWYITKGIKVKKPTIHICYCHTPPRWLYGYTTPIEWRKFWPFRLYGEIVGHFLRQYDYQTSQKVDYFIANSKEVKSRIAKFYRRDSVVIYPPVDLKWDVRRGKLDKEMGSEKAGISTQEISLQNPISHFSFPTSYFLVVSRLEGAKKIDLAIEACNRLGCELWVVGTGSQEKYLKSIAGPTIKFLGRIEDRELWNIYKNCKALICTAVDEDFGITPVEAMAAGRPVVAYRGGGYLETVVENKTGVFYDEPTTESLCEGIKRLGSLGDLGVLRENCQKQAEKFGKNRFKKEIVGFIQNIMSEKADKRVITEGTEKGSLRAQKSQ